MNGHNKINGNGTIDEMTSTNLTTIKIAASTVITSIGDNNSSRNNNNSNCNKIDNNGSTDLVIKPSFRLNGNRYIEQEEYSTGEQFFFLFAVQF